jgi:hypothetical protein
MEKDDSPEVLYSERKYVSIVRKLGQIAIGIFLLTMAAAIVIILLPSVLAIFSMSPILVVLVIVGLYSIERSIGNRDLLIYKDRIQFSRIVYGSLYFNSVMNLRIVNMKYSGTKYMELIKNKYDSYFISSRYGIGTKKYVEVVTDIDAIIKVLKMVFPGDIIKEEILEK